ncbi:hypothetical protein SNE40_022299 [Patella caerulea]|uniref:Tyrosine-protein phosphatase non-receptor type 23 n=1 Tax=Patella caerulea TaxID=87958 RepID=A0AAN8FWE1_PATCE
MEAVPRLPMLSFDLKHSPEYVEFAPTLKQYIQEHYGEDPALYNKACAEIEQLRQSAVHVSRDFIGCTTLKKYYAQLQFLQGRFQLTEGGETAIAFTWEDIQTGREHIIADIKFEQACILYNIGSLHSILGAVDTRQNAEGMKVSCTHFQCAAWAFEHLRDYFGSSAMSTDMAHEMLTFQVNLMLAQAQECILEKSMIDSRKNTITAKVAAQVVEFYKLAIKNLDICNTEGLVNSRSYKDWKKRMELKVCLYQCITYYYTGKESEEKGKWGETLAYFTASNDKLNESVKLAKNEVPEIQDALKFAQDVVGGKYNSAKKDNDFVYHDKVPPLDTLPEIKGASLVKGIPFNPNDTEISGPDIFQKLVPMEAHEASSVYSEEKAKVLRLVAGEVDEKNAELDQFLSSLQIDESKLTPPVDRLPEDLLEKCAALSVRTHAIQDLIDQMSAVSSVSTDVDLNIKEILELLEEEMKKEEEFQKLMGNRTNNIILSEIRKETEICQEKHKQGTLSNENLHAAMNMHITNLRLLAGPPETILTSLPPSQPEKSPGDEAVVDELRKLLNKVEEMKNQRTMLHDQLRDQIQSDDITNVLVIQDGGNKETIFNEQLKKHDKLKTLLEQNMMAQNNILQALTECNAKYATIRQNTAESVVRRESRVKELINSYNVYEDLMAKSQKGLEFYKKLEETVCRLLQRCRGVCKVQQEERDQIQNRFAPKVPPPSRPSAPKPPTPSPSSPQPTLPSFDGPKLKDYLPFMKPATFGPKSKRGSATPSPSPSLDGVDSPQHFQGVHSGIPEGRNVPASYPNVPYDPKIPQVSLPGPDLVQGQNLPPDVAAQTLRQDQRSEESPRQPASLPNLPMATAGSQYNPNMMNQYPSQPNAGNARYPVNPGPNQMYRQDSTSTVSSVDTPVISPTNESQHLHHGLPQRHPQRNEIVNPQGPSGPQSLPTYSTPNQMHQQYAAPPGNQGQMYNNSLRHQNPVSVQQPYIPQHGAVNSSQTPSSHSQAYNPSAGNQQYNYQQPGHLVNQQGHQLPTVQGTQSKIHPGTQQPMHQSNQISMQTGQQQQMYPGNQQAGFSGNPQAVPPGSQYWQRPSPSPSPNQVQSEASVMHTQYPQRTSMTAPQQYPQNSQPSSQQSYVYQQTSQQSQPQTMMQQVPPNPQYHPRGPMPTGYQSVNTSQAVGLNYPSQSHQNNTGYPLQGERFPVQPNASHSSVPGYYPTQQSQPNMVIIPQSQVTTQAPNPTGSSVQTQYGYQQPRQSPQHQTYQPSANQQPMNNPVQTQTIQPASVGQYAPQGTNIQQGQYGGQNAYSGQTLQQPPQMPNQTSPMAPPGQVAPVAMQLGTGQGPRLPQSAQMGNTGQNVQGQMLQNQGHIRPPVPGYQQQPNQYTQQPTGSVVQQGMSQVPQGSTQSQFSNQQGQYMASGQTQPGQLPNQQGTYHQTTPYQNPNSSSMQYNPRGPAVPQQQAPGGQSGYQQQYQPYQTPQGQYVSPNLTQISGQPVTGGMQKPQQYSGVSGQQTGVHQRVDVGATSFNPGTARMPMAPQVPSTGLKLPVNLQQPLQPAPSQTPALPLRQTTQAPLEVRNTEQQKAPVIPQEPQSSHPSTPVNLPPTTITPNLSRQSSSLDEILSSSPDSVKQAAIPDPVIAPKVLTAQEKQQQKEEAMKNRGIPESKDPYSHPAALNKLVLDVETFGKCVDDLSANEASAHSRVDIIWRELMEYQEQEGKKNSIAIARCYPMKNRDQDIMPYDATRVMLSTVKDDYINASWINDLAPSCPKFITTQTPLPVTTTDFWVMVYEQGTEVVVMITSEYETGKKYPIYWPTEKGKAMEHGQVILNLQSVKYKGLWTERIIYMLHTETKQGRTIVHLLYKNWPVSGFPDDVSHIVKFINEAHTFYKQQRSLMKPIIVHCGNGIGRSGTFILIYTGMQEIIHGNGMIEIPVLTKRLLSKRKNCIQNTEQLRFAYEALLYFAEDFLKRRNILVYNPHYKKQKPKPPTAHTSADDIVLGSVNLQTIQQNVGRLGEKHDSTGQILLQGQTTTVTDTSTKGDNLSSLPDLIQQQSKADNGVPPCQPIVDSVTQDVCPASPLNRSRSGSNSSVLSSGSLSSATSKSSPQHKAEVKASPLADLQNPNTFTLDSNDKGKKRITKASFSASKKTSIKDNLDTSDPLSNLDPLWSIAKDKK